uniref:WGR domain-containing protein n=1 Tax=viral metagenome TaxID=1070528 RepID=A0A6C0F534_9ZZZZ|tara:strand:+ start:182 stop:913 length:732 start_codon:yes stop_codon:yes gene_type:complete
MAKTKKRTVRKSKKKTQKRGRKTYYGIKNNKVIELYPHKIKKSIGRHKYIILWKTTKENLPGKTFHGKFYKSKEEAMENIKQEKQTGGKSKKKTKSNSAYFEYKSIFGSSNKFWRIVKDGTKITTHYGKIGSLGRMTTKDYGSKVDVTYDKLIESKKKKGYVEGFDYGDEKPKPPTKIQREYVKVCRKTEKNSKLNPGSRNFDCEGMLDREDNTLQLMTDWYKDAMKKGDFDWSKYEKHLKRK